VAQYFAGYAYTFLLIYGAQITIILNEKWNNIMLMLLLKHYPLTANSQVQASNEEHDEHAVSKQLCRVPVVKPR